MSGIVIELQVDILNSKSKVSDLLRKALVISKKLNVSSIENWLNHELNGYDGLGNNDIPNYREVSGNLRVWNPYHGWQALILEDFQAEQVFSRRKVKQSISELESFDFNGKNIFQIPFPGDVKTSLMSRMDVPLEPTLIIPETEIIGILDSVKNRILEWSLELEKQGVKGENMTFTPKEQEAAKQATTNITNNFGDIVGSQIQQNSSGASQVMNISNKLDEILKLIKQFEDNKNQLELVVEDEKMRELEAGIATLKSQVNSPKPNSQVISITLECMQSILSNATGSLIAQQLLSLMQF